MSTKGRIIKEIPTVFGVLKEGSTVYEYSGITYGCIVTGTAVTKEPDKIPFFEIPKDAVKW